MKLEVCNTTEVDKYIEKFHYLKSVPAGAKVRLWIKEDNNKIIGAMMWGRPTARVYDCERIMELTRMYLIDDTERFVESKALSMARKLIRKKFPEVKGLIAYCSTGEKHSGTIYLADGWFAVGQTTGGSWGDRNGNRRKNIDTSKKIRYVRSV